MRLKLLPAFFLSLAVPALPQSPDSSATLKVTTRLVYVDVIVRDSYGREVRGLAERDFKVSEDGHPQKIDFFTPHVYDPAAAIPTKPASSKNAGTPLKFSNISAAHSGAINIILLDLVNTPQQDQIYARQQLLRFLKQLPPSQQIALFVLSDRLHMIQGFTDSSDQLLGAAQHIDPKDFHLMRSETQMMQDSDLLANFAAAMGHDPAGMIAHMQAGHVAEDARSEDVRAISTLGAFNELARAVSGYSGRKNLFWMAESFPLSATAQLQINDLSSDVRFQIADLPGARDTANLIASAQIAVYPLSLAGLETGGVGSSISGTGESFQMGATLQAQFVVRQQMRATINDLARQTGGEAFYGTNDFAGALRRGIGDGSNYYTLAYRPSNQDWNGKFRKIQVDLQTRGYSLSYRRGYFAATDITTGNNAETTLNAALMPGAPESTMLGITSAIVPPDAAHPALQVDSILDINNLQFSDGPGGSRHAQIVVALIARKNSGSQEPATEAKSTLNLDLSSEQYKSYLVSGIHFRQQLPLPPGSYLVQIGVSDLTNHRLGTLNMPVEVGGAAKSVAAGKE